MEPVEACEVEVAAVEHIVRSPDGEEQIERLDIVPVPIGDGDHLGDVPAEVEERVEFDRPLVLAEPGPREQRQAEVDRRRVEGVHGGREVHPEGLGRVEGLGNADEGLGKVGIDPPVARLVGIRERAARHPAPDAHVVEPGLHRAETRLDVAEALPVGPLGEGQTQELVEAREAADLVLALVAGHAGVELRQREALHDLREDGATTVHGPLLS